MSAQTFALSPPEAIRRWTVPDVPELYRYQLGREWDPALPKVFLCGLNPSVAGSSKPEDKTSLKWIRYAKRWGFGGYIAVNVYARILTDSAQLHRLGGDIVGPENDFWITEAFLACKLHVVCWGSKGGGSRSESILRELRANGCEPHALRITAKTRQPEHPLYLPESLTPRPLAELLRAGANGPAGPSMGAVG